MSSSAVLPSDFVTRAQHRVLNLYGAIVILMLLAIAVLTVYCLRLGPLVGPGVEDSFGLAVALLFLCGAVIVHVVDYAYRVWPEGRGVRPAFPGFITDRGLANALKILVLVAAGAAVAYLFATLITS